MHTRALRVLRGTAAALVATFTAALSHQLAGAVAPSFFGMAISLTLSVALCTLLAGRTVSLTRLTIAIVASQAMYHLLFSAMLAPAGVAQHDMSAMTFSLSSAAQTASSVMSLSHLAGAAITIVIFRYAEVALWGLLTTARLFITRLLAAVVPLSMRGSDTRFARVLPHVPSFSTRFLSAMRYRGPPVAESAA